MTALRPDLLPDAAELFHLRQVAIGAAEPDLLIRGGRVLSVQTGEFLDRDVLVAGRHLAAITPPGHRDAKRILDAGGRHVVPTFIDAHLHIEYTMLTPAQLARISVPRGTTTVLTDPDCMANVAGLRGMDYMLATRTPLRIFEQVTPHTPANPLLERGGAHIPEADVLERLADPATVTLGESNPFDYGPVATERYRRALLAGRRITGHTARQSGEPLWGYLAGGVGDDHNAATADEVLERVRLGAMVTLMAGSLADNTTSVFADVDRIAPALGHLCFCADDKHVEDLAAQGHIDHHVRQAVRLGVPVEIAYQMATWTPALYYRIDHLVGQLAPTRLADLQLIGDLADARPDVVLVGGKEVARDGTALFAADDPIPAWTRDTIHVAADFGAAAFAVPADGPTAWVQAMEMYDGYFKRAFHTELPVRAGSVTSDTDRDVLKIAVVDRHHGDGLTGIGFVRGFGLRRGALAVSTNCTNMNIVVVGVHDDDLTAAVHAVRRQGGGYVAVCDGVTAAAVPLPVAGLMSDQPWETVRTELSAAHAAAADLGCAIPSPYMILSFVGLGGVPDLGLTECGLIDAVRQQFTDLVLPGGPTLGCRCPSHGFPVHALMDARTAR